MSRRSFLIGLIGQGIAGSLSPAMHESEGAAQGLGYAYRRLDLDAIGATVRDLPQVFGWARRMGFDGLNITHPCKQAVIDLLDDLSPDARALSAVNTVVFRDGHAVGYNTDWTGFARSFARGLPDAGTDRVVLFGAGGAGAAVGYAMLTLGAGHLTVIDTDYTRADALATLLGARFGPDRASAATDHPAAVSAADGVINATPIGMTGHPGTPFEADLIRSGMWVADVVYFPIQTELLAQAAARGARTLSGGGMAVFQAVDAFRLFTGREPDVSRMLTHFAYLIGAESAPSSQPS